MTLIKKKKSFLLAQDLFVRTPAEIKVEHLLFFALGSTTKTSSRTFFLTFQAVDEAGIPSLKTGADTLIELKEALQHEICKQVILEMS